jgi:hypothetical protein
MLLKKALLHTIAMSLCVSSLIVANDALVVKRASLMTAGLGKIKVSHDSEGFSVNQNGISHRVALHDIDPQLRTISTGNLAKYLTVAKLSVTKVGDNFAIRSHVPGKGGGPICGVIAYWVTKVFLASTATTAAVATNAAATVTVAGAPVTVGATVASIPMTVAAIEASSQVMGAAVGAMPWCP